MQKNALINRIHEVISNGGPNWLDYAELDYIIEELGKMISRGEIHSTEINLLKSQCKFLRDTNSIMGHILNKPFGYAGDFMIIDKIYTHSISSVHYKWDDFSLNHPAANAVKNRKEYFKKYMGEHLKTGKLLNIASGPARDVCEWLDKNPNNNVNITCVEMDANAIEYAQQINRIHIDKIKFIKKNIFRFETGEKYHVIWSAGLFDYFDDKAFVRLLKKMSKWVNPGGEIIIGNFNASHNPSRTFMEVFGEWFLQHRTAEDLKRLAVEAGFERGEIRVECERENVNLFLHIKTPY